MKSDAAVKQGRERAFLAVLAQSKRTHPLHASMLIKTLLGRLKSLDRGLNDDPALAACQILDQLPAVISESIKLLEWATVVNQCEPHEVPTKGATCRNFTT